MTDYQKIIDVMCWEVFDGETPEQTFVRESRNNTPPPDIVVDIVEAGGLDVWANNQRVKSQAELYERIMRAIRKTIADPIFNDRQRVNNFPPFATFSIIVSIWTGKERQPTKHRGLQARHGMELYVAGIRMKT